MADKKIKKITVPTLLSYKKKDKKIVMVTAYDATFARLMDATLKIDAILVGDSLGMVIQGHTSTIPVTLDDIIYHCRSVARGTKKAHICADMPFMANKVTPEKTLEYAARLMQEGHAESVKVEGGVLMAGTIKKITASGIPVMGHVGMTPQSVHAFGGFKIQGRTISERERILQDARAVADAGAFAIVLEGIPKELTEKITDAVSIPTIGIGAGPDCNGQVLVSYDLLGMNNEFKPKFLKRYASLADDIQNAVSLYAHEVTEGIFPGKEHSTEIKR